MNVSRRDFAVASALAFGASGLLASGAAKAQPADEAAVKAGIETLRKAAFEADKAGLERISAAQLSYGHSDGRVETREQFINGVMTRKATVKSIAFPDLHVWMIGNNAVARHIYTSEAELDGKVSNTKIGALQVWQKQDGVWKLLARQGFRLPA